MSGSNAGQRTYYDHIGEAIKPISERKETVTGRNGQKRAIRRHHMTMQVQTELLRQSMEGGKLVSPYKKFTSYWGVVAALSDLGENQWHSPGDILKAMEARMSHEDSKNKRGKTAWDRFKGRPARSKDRGLDYLGRLIQNLNVLQRLGGGDPYGLKLAQLGACIDIKPNESGLTLAKLRTGVPKGEPITPLNEIKRKKCVRGVESIPSQVTFPEKLGTSNKKSPAIINAPNDEAAVPVEAVSGASA